MVSKQAFFLSFSMILKKVPGLNKPMSLIIEVIMKGEPNESIVTSILETRGQIAEPDNLNPPKNSGNSLRMPDIVKQINTLRDVFDRIKHIIRETIPSMFIGCKLGKKLLAFRGDQCNRVVGLGYR